MDCKNLILDDDSIELIGQNALPTEQKMIMGEGWCVESVDEYLRIFYGDSTTLPELNATEYPYSAIPKIYGITPLGNAGMIRSGDNLSLEAAGILTAQNPPLRLTGKGVICAFLDTGIKYQEKVFRRSDGKTRILTIWDQTIQSGKEPEGFDFGSEYTASEIDEALQEENPYDVVPVTDENGHGTILASIAAGSDLRESLNYIGAAPDAELAIVKLRQAKENLRKYYGVSEETVCFSETDIILAIEYLQKLAIRYSKPVVICIGLGTSYGEHAGISPISRYCSRVARRINRVVVVGTGNEGNKAHHTQGIIGENEEIVEIRVDEGVESFILEIWGRIPYLFTATVRSPSGELIPEIGLRLENQFRYQFLFDKTNLTVDSVVTEMSSGEQLLRMKFQNPSAGIWTVLLRRRGNEGEVPYHAWLPLSSFMTAQVYFMTPSPYVTLTEPSSSEDAIAVAAYQDSNNSIYPPSGRGYTGSGNIKPDLAAPGVRITSILGEVSGSDAAAAILAGASAQYMQWAVTEENQMNANSQTLKNFLIRGARRLPTLTVPNREFGWGFLDLENSFRQYLL